MGSTDKFDIDDPERFSSLLELAESKTKSLSGDNPEIRGAWERIKKELLSGNTWIIVVNENGALDELILILNDLFQGTNIELYENKERKKLTPNETLHALVRRMRTELLRVLARILESEEASEEKIIIEIKTKPGTRGMMIEDGERTQSIETALTKLLQKINLQAKLVIKGKFLDVKTTVEEFFGEDEYFIGQLEGAEKLFLDMLKDLEGEIGNEIIGIVDLPILYRKRQLERVLSRNLVPESLARELLTDGRDELYIVYEKGHQMRLSKGVLIAGELLGPTGKDLIAFDTGKFSMSSGMINKLRGKLEEFVAKGGNIVRVS